MVSSNDDFCVCKAHRKPAHLKRWEMIVVDDYHCVPLFLINTSTYVSTPELRNNPRVPWNHESRHVYTLNKPEALSRSHQCIRSNSCTSSFAYSVTSTMHIVNIWGFKNCQLPKKMASATWPTQACPSSDQFRSVWAAGRSREGNQEAWHLPWFGGSRYWTCWRKNNYL